MLPQLAAETGAQSNAFSYSVYKHVHCGFVVILTQAIHEPVLIIFGKTCY